MRILITLAIIIVAAYLGYKLAEITITNKQIKSNIVPIVDELKIQLGAIQTKLEDPSLTADQKKALQNQMNNILGLLGQFYGYTTDQLKTILNKTTT